MEGAPRKEYKLKNTLGNSESSNMHRTGKRREGRGEEKEGKEEERGEGEEEELNKLSSESSILKGTIVIKG